MKKVSEEIRKQYRLYWVKFGFRILVLTAVTGLVIFYPEELNVLEGMHFFQHVSFLHIVWALWAWYMVEKLLPLQNTSRGSKKYRRSEFQPAKEYEAWLECRQNRKPESERMAGREDFGIAFQQERRKYARGAGRVLGAWILAALVIFLLKRSHILGNRELLLLSALFYVGDLVCILIWCPFRDVLMKNRCCTQCRIYNWDTLMLILPVAFVPGFYSYSLLGGALLVVGCWEIAHVFHPERFYALTNASLQCRNCKGELGCARYRKGGRKG